MLKPSFYFIKIIIFAGLFKLSSLSFLPSLNGHYTKDIYEYILSVPHRLSSRGEFISYDLPHFFEQDYTKTNSKRSVENEADSVNYGVKLDDKSYHLQVWPNHALIAPDAVTEISEPNTKVNNKKIKKINHRKVCHFVGTVKDLPGSRVALSTCHGLAGFILIGNDRYFIEPLEGHQPNDYGQHLHIVYQKDKLSRDDTEKCGTVSKNWEDIWRERFRQKLAEKREVVKNKQIVEQKTVKRGLESIHRYLETLIVADKKFVLHHRYHDVETYILTIMNMVTDFYHDESIGNQIDVTVVRILYLEKEEEEIDLVINQNADDTLASFCKWQQRINPADIGNPNHHDIAVLMTRHDICAENVTKCGLTGLAYVGTACDKKENCAINEDTGLVLGIVVAHEMGHVMGCSHDAEGESSCVATDTDGSYFVMAPFVHLFTTRWSTCSRAFITALFDNDLGECLNDEPQISLYSEGRPLPGVVYDADAQCQIIFPESNHYIEDPEKFCDNMLCLEASTNMVHSNGEPMADGTKCGENKWCYRKQCVDSGNRPMAINGGWGEWKSPSACSRTCGGGVSISERDCNNPAPANKGRYCLGDRRKITICNTQPCPKGSTPYREVQCAEEDNKPHDGKMHKWKSFFVENSPCQLYCINEAHVYVKLQPRVKDGTPCKAGTKNMCISGSCVKIGCDYVVNSNAVEDACGVCNGDGTQCKFIENIFREVGHNYHKVVTFPEGCRSILVEEFAPSPNTIAISDKSEKKFYLNGEYSELPDGNYNFGGSEGYYSHPEPDKEHLVIHGPLTEDLVLFVVFYNEDNVGYKYRYSEPSPESDYHPKYHWEILEYSECSVKCGGGFQEAELSCVEEKAGKVSGSFCEGIDKPQGSTKKCKEQACKIKWRVGKWSKCYACRYKSGVRMREVECVRESQRVGAEDILVEDHECDGPKPAVRELCNSHTTCKERRHSVDLPENLMRDVYLQTMNSVRQRCVDGAVNESHPVLPELGIGHGKAKIHPGTIIKDTVPPGGLKVIEYPVKVLDPKNQLNLSDTAFETIGDQVGGIIDKNNTKILSGDESSKILNEKHKEEKKP